MVCISSHIWFLCFVLLCSPAWHQQPVALLHASAQTALFDCPLDSTHTSAYASFHFTVFCFWWVIPPCFLFVVGRPTLFSVCGGTSHPVFCFWWDIPPCFLFLVGCPTLFSVCSGTFLLGTLTLSPQKGNSQHQPFSDSEFNHFGWSNYIGIFF